VGGGMKGSLNGDVAVRGGATLGGGGEIFGKVDFKASSTFNVQFELGLTLHDTMSLASGVTLDLEGFTGWLVDNAENIGEVTKLATFIGGTDFLGAAKFTNLTLDGSAEGFDGSQFVYGEGKYNIYSDNTGLYLEVVPEPTTWALLVGGLGVLALMRRRRS